MIVPIFISYNFFFCFKIKSTEKFPILLVFPRINFWIFEIPAFCVLFMRASDRQQLKSGAPIHCSSSVSHLPVLRASSGRRRLHLGHLNKSGRQQKVLRINEDILLMQAHLFPTGLKLPALLCQTTTTKYQIVKSLKCTEIRKGTVLGQYSLSNHLKWLLSDEPLP